jgi:hypothetical protein
MADYARQAVESQLLEAQLVDNSEILDLKEQVKQLQNVADRYRRIAAAAMAISDEHAYYEREYKRCQNENNQLKTQKMVCDRMANAPSAGGPGTDLRGVPVTLEAD